MMCPDNYDRWRAHQAQQDREEAEYYARLPYCEKCGKQIDEDTFISVEGYHYHEDCFLHDHRVYTEDFVNQ